MESQDFLKNFWGKVRALYIIVLMSVGLAPTLFCVNVNVQKPKRVGISSVQRLLDNFHTVESGALYRSGQLAPGMLERYIKKYHIKTIINLRGRHNDLSWWKKEQTVASIFGVQLYNLSMTARRHSDKKILKKLLYFYSKAPRPILIHCFSGADRTGEAAALWVLEQQKRDKKVALKQLSLKYRYLYITHPCKYHLIKHWKHN